MLAFPLFLPFGHRMSRLIFAMICQYSQAMADLCLTKAKQLNLTTSKGKYKRKIDISDKRYG
jgi:hypothetical protein